MKRIGSLKLGGEVFLAPMADYTNIAFRTLCREYGAAMVYTELISAKAIAVKSGKTFKMMETNSKERPIALQLFGNNPDDFGKAVKIAEKMGERKKSDEPNFTFDAYDLNCGCSVPKALKGKYGVALMEKPKLVGEIISEMRSKTKKPVMLKMRLGYKTETFLEVAEEAEKAGALAIALHPRLGTEDYSEKAKWEKIKELKKSTKMPVIGNGNIAIPADVLEMKKETGCDFEMIGRAAVGNAFLFRQASALLKGANVLVKYRKETFVEGKRFLELINGFKLGVNDAKPYFIGTARGFEGAAEARNAFALAKSLEKIEEIFNKNFG
ncbi:MAG: tRNA-dihydrouridine synthase family protein [Candidatus Diapherotrites archaeon]|nr:tRNA-dihydrouridine synthase family protein [Candidatus Diapherotrites archaeon]